MRFVTDLINDYLLQRARCTLPAIIVAITSIVCCQHLKRYHAAVYLFVTRQMVAVALVIDDDVMVTNAKQTNTRL